MPGDLVELSLATVPAAISISRVLRRELAAGRSPEQIEQIEFVGDTLDMASPPTTHLQRQPPAKGWPLAACLRQ